MFYSNPNEPIIAFAVCDSSPSEQMYDNPELVHTMGFITFPSESKVADFLLLVEDKLSTELGKPAKLQHWKKYRNTPRGIEKKDAVYYAIVESVCETKGVNIFGVFEKEKSIIRNHLKNIETFNLSPYITIKNGKYEFGPFNLPVDTVSLKKRAFGHITINRKPAIGILHCAFNQIRMYNSLRDIYKKTFPTRPFTLDLRLDLLPLDDVRQPKKLFCLMGLLVKSTDGGVSPVAQILDKNHLSDILADNITGMFARWYSDINEENMRQGFGVNENGEERGSAEGIHFAILV
jgi:hypothetical protein